MTTFTCVIQLFHINKSFVRLTIHRVTSFIYLLLTMMIFLMLKTAVTPLTPMASPLLDDDRFSFADTAGGEANRRLAHHRVLMNLIVLIALMDLD